jgi:para-nitrobenzyl esterase
VALAPPALAQVNAAAVRTESGPVRGVKNAQVESFKGIRYAMPPIGKRRWRAPEPPIHRKSVVYADHYGSDCMQIPFAQDDAPLRTRPSEDCLYLNVWRPAKSLTKKLPVMVWIHGGGFVNGGSSPAIYDGSAFARSGVILVSFNYRLGRFGFFAHPALTREASGGPTANFALLDQIAALEWVKRNIAAFGGDPTNVTICGESAGGMSVHLLMIAPQARGLFARAIVESGGGRDVLGGMKTLAGAEDAGVKFAQDHGIADTGPQGLDRLRALPASEITDGLNLATLFDRPDFSGPIIDGKVTGSSVAAAYETGKVANVPMIIGTNDADGIFFSNDLDAAYALVGPHRIQAEGIYDPEAKHDAQRIGVAIWADTLMLEPARYISREMAKLGKPVYAYRFAYVPELLRDTLQGARHASDIPFVFRTLEARYGEQASPADLREAALVHAFWIGFAKTGIPKARGHGQWERYNPALDQLYIFGRTQDGMGREPFRKRLDFIEQIRAKP